MLRELVAVTETGTDLDRAWAQQAIDALLALNEAAGAARAAGHAAVDAHSVAAQMTDPLWTPTTTPCGPGR